MPFAGATPRAEQLKSDQAVAERLKRYRAERRVWGGLDAETLALVARDPFAFLVAVAFDRGMPWRKAWQISVEIHRKGMLEPQLLATMSDSELEGLLDSLPVRPRYGTERGAKTLSDAARLVSERFGGDASAIWQDTSPTEVKKTLQEIHGVGPGIAAVTTRILYDDFGCFRGQEHQIDVNPDVHVLRVFQRAGLIASNSEKEAVLASRRMNPQFPDALDWAAWQVAQHWCHPTQPDCGSCCLTAMCPRKGLKAPLRRSRSKDANIFRKIDDLPGWAMLLASLGMGLGIGIAIILAIITLWVTAGPWLTILSLLALVVFGAGRAIDRFFPRDDQ